ncbi:MAG: DUF2934 domain-containing protein [Phycisphaerales bacterium]|nr:DUF2934 domain-containing protein [Phycisphaerales bacterium]
MAGPKNKSSPAPATKAPSAPASPPAPPAPPITVRHEDVANAAYFLWLKRGGDAHANWCEAERLLRNGQKP